MQGHNAQFVADPLGYMRGVVVDNVTWFRNIANAGAVGPLNIAKHGQFDLQFVEMNPERKVLFTVANGPVLGDMPIAAYWCPFLAGNGLPGFVDVPRANPAHPFVFTAAMQGCALVVTDSPAGAGQIRVYHHQHPDNNAVWQQIGAQGQEPVSVLTFDDYGVEGAATNAFNFLWYRNAKWNFVTLAHNFNPDASVRRRPELGESGVEIRSALP
ncbi:MAG: hypothetical protein IPM29_06950 [Planctomycetes bacterium]|nr:hypothetical protein [Planctomycetota bacterium]